MIGLVPCLGRIDQSKGQSYSDILSNTLERLIIEVVEALSKKVTLHSLRLHLYPLFDIDDDDEGRSPYFVDIRRLINPFRSLRAKEADTIVYDTICSTGHTWTRDGYELCLRATAEITSGEPPVTFQDLVHAVHDFFVPFPHSATSLIPINTETLVPDSRTGPGISARRTDERCLELTEGPFHCYGNICIKPHNVWYHELPILVPSQWLVCSLRGFFVNLYKDDFGIDEYRCLGEGAVEYVQDYLDHARRQLLNGVPLQDKMGQPLKQSKEVYLASLDDVERRLQILKQPGFLVYIDFD